jgi:hypothetical protein
MLGLFSDVSVFPRTIDLAGDLILCHCDPLDDTSVFFID